MFWKQSILALSMVLWLSALGTANANSRSTLLTGRALDALERGDSALAVRLLEQATAADPKDSDARLQYGRALLQIDHAEKALEVLADIPAIDGQPVNFERGVALFKLQRWSEAEADLAQAIDLEPEHNEARFFLALARYRQNRFAQAAPDFEIASRDAALAPDALYMRGLALLRTGRQEEAVESLERAASIQNSSAGEQARALLAELRGPKQKNWRLRVNLSHQTDTNVLLVQTDRAAADQLFTPEEISQRTGNRWVLNLDGSYRHAFDRQWSLTAGYTGYQSYHRTHRDILQNFDVSSHTVRLRPSWSKDKWAIVLPVHGNISLLGPLFNARNGEKLGLYTRSLGASLNGIYAPSETQVITAGYALAAEDFADVGLAVPVDSGKTVSLNRDNLRHSLQGRYVYAFEGGGYLSPNAGLFLSQAKGADNAWDHKGARLALEAASPTYGFAQLQLSAGIAYRNYENGYPVQNGDDAFTLKIREDTEATAGGQVLLQWDWLQGQVGAFWQRNISTTPLFDYSRVIYSIGLGAEL